MAIARDTTAKNIKPLTGAKIRRFTCGDTVAAGEICEMQSDGKMDPAIATAVVLNLLGIALQAGGDGEVVDFVVHGPVQCLTGASPGSPVYVSDTAGEPSETAGTKDTIVGHSESATVLFVDPQIIDFS